MDSEEQAAEKNMLQNIYIICDRQARNVFIHQLGACNGVTYVIRSTPPIVCRHFKNCVRQFSKTSWWKSSFIGFEFSTSIIIGCDSVNNTAALPRCLILWKILCASHLPYPKENQNNFVSLPIYIFRGLWSS